MAQNKYNLQIVGVFFNGSIQLEQPAPATVLSDLMDAFTAAAAKGSLQTIKGTPVSKFQYADNGPSVTAFNVQYAAGFSGRVTAAKYEAGEYFLAEDLTTLPAYSVWQYYIYDAENRQLNFDKGSLSFKKAMVPAGGTAVWRLVNVLANVNPPPPVARLGLNAAPTPLG